MRAASRTTVRTLVAGPAALLLVGAGLTVLGLTGSGSADAATPAEGSVSAGGDHGVSWTGGPFAAPNVTGTALDVSGFATPYADCPREPSPQNGKDRRR